MHDDILGFDIPVDDLVGVQLTDGRDYLSHDPSHPGLRHADAGLELLVELAAQGDLEYDVDIVGVVEVAVHFGDVRVVQEYLDLQLPDELLGYLLLL